MHCNFLAFSGPTFVFYKATKSNFQKLLVLSLFWHTHTKVKQKNYQLSHLVFVSKVQAPECDKNQLKVCTAWCIKWWLLLKHYTKCFYIMYVSVCVCYTCNFCIKNELSPAFSTMHTHSLQKSSTILSIKYVV